MSDIYITKLWKETKIDRKTGVAMPLLCFRAAQKPQQALTTEIVTAV